jgi:hypothetical protein
MLISGTNPAPLGRALVAIRNIPPLYCDHMFRYGSRTGSQVFPANPMPQRVFSTSTDLRRLAPWTQLFQSFRLALRIRQLLLAALGVTLTVVGWRLLETALAAPVPSDTGAPILELTPWPWDRELGYGLTSESELSGEPPINTLWALSSGLREPQRFFGQVFGNWSVALEPVTELLTPGQKLFEPTASASERVLALLKLGWWLMVWSLFGGAVTRSAAVEFARDQNCHLSGAVRFAGQYYFSYLVGPVLTLLAVLGVGVLLTLAGLLSRVPLIGPVVGGLGGGLLLIVGLLLAILVMGLAVGWPLMFATVSVEGTDGFDGMSRAFNYVYERPLLYLGQIVLSMIFGSFAIFCVLFLAQLGSLLTLQGLALAAPASWSESIANSAPQLLAPPLDNTDWLPPVPSSGAEPVGTDRSASPPGWAAGTSLFSFWLHAWATLVQGFVYSFFWSSATVIYFVLRHSVDGNELDEVFTGIHPEPDDLLPLEGAAKMGVELSPPPDANSSLPPDNPPYAAPR